MKTARRHELQTNELADHLGPFVGWCRANLALILASVLGVVVVVGAFFYFQGRSQERAASAWDEFFKAQSANDQSRLVTLVERQPDTTAGVLAALYLADLDFVQGVNLMSTDREQAEARLNDAKNRYVHVRQAAGDPHVRERAVLGLARYYESMGLFDDAKREYAAVRDLNGGLYKTEAERKLKLLEQPSAVAFAEWYRKQRPKPKPTATGMFHPDDVKAVPPDESTFPAASGTATSGTATPAASSTGTAAPAAPSAVSTSSAPPAAPKATASATAAVPTATGAK